MEKYVVGLVFDETERVMLIEKKRPDWQKGVLNGVGGEIKENETPLDAMIRECKEESGLFIHNWHLYDAVTFNNGIELNYFCCLVKKDFLDTAKTLTDEKILIYPCSCIVGKLHNDIKQMIDDITKLGAVHIDFVSKYELLFSKEEK